MIRLFRHYVALGSLVELLVDGLVYFGALLLAMWLQKSMYIEAITANDVALASAFALLMVGINSAFGVYRSQAFPWKEAVLRLTLTTLLGCTIVYGVVWLTSAEPFSLSAIRLAAPYALIALFLWRHGSGVVRRKAIGGRRVLIVGNGGEAESVTRVLNALTHPKFAVVGLYPVAEAVGDTGGLRVFGRGTPLWDIVQRERVLEVVVAAREQRGGALPLRDLLECRVHGVRITDITALHERVRGEFPLESLRASWLIFSHGFEQGWLRSAVKRVFDLVSASVLLLLAAPVMALTAILIKLESPGPAIYRQQRVGQGGRLFWCLKFRSMRTDAEKDGVARWAQRGDPRVTRVGRVIRKLRIDELPQLVNVLRGEMSLVGPRPERPAFVDELKKEIRFYDLRHSVKPGLTGWAQVRFSYAASLEDARRKLQYDLYYVKNHSLFLDCVILLETVRVVLLREGAQ